MPIDGVNSGIVEASEKISYTLKLDKKPEIDPDTGGSIQKPMIFSDSFMDDPQITGLQHELERFHSRGLMLDSENRTLKERCAHAEVIVTNLQFKVQTLAETGL